MFLHQGHHALIKRGQVRIADEQANQDQQAHATDPGRGAAMAAQAAGRAQADHHRDTAGDDARLQPETFR
ncbi:hypothetical protein D3C87_1447610 [compost metagenome]